MFSHIFETYIDLKLNSRYYFECWGYIGEFILFQDVLGLGELYSVMPEKASTHKNRDIYRWWTTLKNNNNKKRQRGREREREDFTVMFYISYCVTLPLVNNWQKAGQSSTALLHNCSLYQRIIRKVVLTAILFYSNKRVFFFSLVFFFSPFFLFSMHCWSPPPLPNTPPLH